MSIAASSDSDGSWRDWNEGGEAPMCACAAAGACAALAGPDDTCPCAESRECVESCVCQAEDGPGFVCLLSHAAPDGRHHRSARLAWAFVRQHTGFNVMDFSKHHDEYAVVKVMNFVCNQASSCTCTADVCTTAAACFRDGARLVAAADGDEWLAPQSACAELIPATLSMLMPAEDDAPAAAAAASSDAATIAALQARVAALTADLDTARSLLQRSVGDDDVPAAAPVDNDSYYFESYAKAGIHYDMLSDAARTDAYETAINSFKSNFASAPTDVVDVGCGTGILSLMCARAGARSVLAIDASTIAADAVAHVAANGWDRVIKVLHSKAEDAIPSLPRVDMIVSEWMGYACLFESMLPSVLRVRDACLKPGGVMLPSHARLWLAPVSSRELHARTLGFWRDVYGFNMRNMLKHVVAEAQVEVVAPEAIMGAPPTPLRSFNLLQVSVDDLDLRRVAFSHRIARSGDAIACRDVDQCSCVTSSATPSPSACDNMAVHAFAFWFDTLFTDERFAPGAAGTTTAEPTLSAVLDTAPACTTTHWKQTLLLLPRPFCAAEGVEVRGSISFAASTVHTREYEFTLELAEPAHAAGVWTFQMR